MVDLLMVTKELPAGCTGIKLAIEREGDDTGAVLEVTLTAGKVGAGIPNGWYWFESTTIDGQVSSGPQGFCSWELGMSEENWREFTRRLKSTLETSPEQYWSVRVGIIKAE
jgi:hypothetical protein